MLTAKRVFVVIGIVICIMELLSLLVAIVRPKNQPATLPLVGLLRVNRSEVIRRILVWYIGGLISLGTAVGVGPAQPWLEMALGVAGTGALLVGCAGGSLVTHELLWPRFGLSLFTLVILILISLCLSKRTRKA